MNFPDYRSGYAEKLFKIYLCISFAAFARRNRRHALMTIDDM